MPPSPSDMSGRVCVLTGATRGIGRATAHGLAQLGAHLVLLARRREDGLKVSGELRDAGGSADVVVADLSSQGSIRDAARELHERYSRIHVLINNAAVIPRHREITVDGLEMQFAVNHFAYFLLTTLLLEPIRAGAPSRVINVTSGAHSGASLDFDDLQSERGYSPTRAYGRTKLANILFTYELARRLLGTRVTANCLHPGVIDTQLLADFMGTPRGRHAGARSFGASADSGAETSVYLASSPEVEGVTGKYLVDKRERRSSPESYDEAAARRLWVSSEQLSRPTS